MANERIIFPVKEEHHKASPSNGQESWIVTRVWQSVLADHDNRIENYFRGIPETRTNLHYVPAWQPEAQDYLNHCDQEAPIEKRIPLGKRHSLEKLKRALPLEAA